MTSTRRSNLTNITAELGEVHVPHSTPVGSNLTWEGQLAQGTTAYLDTKGALNDRRSWVKWTARALFFAMFGGPILFVAGAAIVGLIQR